MTSTGDVPVLTDGTVTLRAHRFEDAHGVYEQCQDPLSQAWTTVPIPYSLEDAKRFIREAMPGGWRDDAEWGFAVEAKDDDGTPRFAGTVSLRNEGGGRAEIAYGSHPWVRGRGVMTAALELLLAWGFEHRQLQTVIWWANQGNWASRKVAWRLGFSIDGTLRKWLPQRGELLDAWVGVLLAGDERRPRHHWYDVPRIAGRKVVLRPHRSEDAARIQEACSDERSVYWLSHLVQPYTLEDATSYIDSRPLGPATGTGVSWVVADPDSDVLLANISLLDVKPGAEGEIGYWAHPDARGRGVVTEAMRMVIRHAFIPEEDGGLGLKRVTAVAAEGNTASRQVIEANGFVQVGRPRQDHLLGDGTRSDSVAYDLLRQEFSV